MTLAGALSLETSPVGEMTWRVPDGWQQGRGAFGGLTLAALARAASSTLDVSERPLRTLTGEIPGAVAVGPAAVTVTPLRVGRGLSSVAAHLVQGGEVVTHAVLSFGRTRDVAFDRAPEADDLPPFDASAAVNLGAVGPTFAQHFEYRIRAGMPLTRDPEARTEGWVRMRYPGDIPPWLALIAMVDAWYPSVLPVFAEPRPFGTISFAAHFFDRGWRPDEPLFHRSRLLGSQGGYFAELRELFTARGELCAVNQQTMAIIK